MSSVQIWFSSYRTIEI